MLKHYTYICPHCGCMVDFMGPEDFSIFKKDSGLICNMCFEVSLSIPECREKGMIFTDEEINDKFKNSNH